MKKRQLKPKQWFGCYQDQWKGHITAASFQHPAKFAKGLVERILDYMAERKWIAKGDVIGDPFGGVGTGGIVAAYRGYQWIGVELEPKFVDFAAGNFMLHAHRFVRLGVPMPILIQGDSRQFNKIVDAVLSSPPYSTSDISAASDFKSKKCPNSKLAREVHGVITSPPYAGSLEDGGPEKGHPDGYERSNNWTGYGKSDGQIAALKAGDVGEVVREYYCPEHKYNPPANSGFAFCPRCECPEAFTNVDAVVGSPPFLGCRSDTTSSGGGINKRGYEGKHADRPSHRKMAERTYQPGSDKDRDPANIEVLGPGSVSAVIASPPYETISAGAGGLNHLPARDGDKQSGRDPASASQSADQTYGTTPGQIAHCKKASVDAVVSSPPWEKNVEGGRAAGKFKGAAGALKVKRGKGASDKAVLAQAARDETKTIGDSEGQIGQLRSSDETCPACRKCLTSTQLSALPSTTVGEPESYWQAVAKVYHSCLLALKPGGVMALVVKDFCKDKKRMRLCDDTMRLLVWLGFEEVERVHAMLSEERIVEDLFEGTRTIKTERKSFFRRLHEGRLAADDPRRIDFEEVLFVRKPMEQ